MSRLEPNPTNVTGARALYETLRACGITHLFGLDSPEPLYAELDRTEIRPITIRDERAGAIMADAFARISGRPAVCTAIRGPGATNLITGIAEAWATSTPVVAVVNDIATPQVGRNPIQEVDHLALFRPVTKWAVRLDRPDRVAELTSRAFTVATSGRPGPTLVSCPDDVLTGGGAQLPARAIGARRYPSVRIAPDPAAVREAVAVLSDASQPAIVAGGGVGISGAWDELQQVAELLGAPVATTLLGKGALDETHALYAGVMSAYTGGMLGRGRIANEAVLGADVVLLVGTKTDSVSTSGWTIPDPRSRTVHIDIDPAEIGRNYRSLGVVGDAKLALAALADGLHAAGARPRTGQRGEIEKSLRAWREQVRPLLESNARPIRPERVVAEMSRFVDDNTIVCTDASYSSLWALDLMTLRKPGRRIIAPRGFGGIGWGLPAAIGAKFAAPEKRVLCLTGDGAFGYVFQELETAARYNVPVVVVVLNNSCFAFQKHAEQLHYGREFETKLLEVDYSALARTLRCEGASVSDPGLLAPTLQQAIDSGRPTVINVVVDPDAYPPITSFDRLRTMEPVVPAAH
ncbi:MAG: acetolactate synthase catalytic subunit [Candidatus Rokuibacteriota bacterium]|nr:MAG: acetolactate synthase catalytic subunit [Candidatus Rokubacteria bacterium]